MINIEFSLWLASRTRWVHLIKNIQLPVVPRVGEYMKFCSETLGDYFAWKVTQVTYHENGQIAVWTELLDNVDERMYSFEEESELDEYLKAYVSEGWVSPHGVRPNTRFQNQ